MNRIVKTDKAPGAIGPYSQGVVTGNLVFTAMQVALDPQTGTLQGETTDQQARQCLANIQAIVGAAGGSVGTIVKVVVYLTDMTQFSTVNEVYGEFFKDNLPARGVVEVSALPAGALVAIEAIATVV
jgi:2-iminobutanoate/2-iminopropanoate deaminase